MTEEKKAEEAKLDQEKVINSLDDLGNMYNFRNDFDYSYRTDAGLTPDIVREISEKKQEPKWMLDFRLKSLEIYNQIPYPIWGPDISGLDMSNIITYVRPNTQMKAAGTMCRTKSKIPLTGWVFPKQKRPLWQGLAPSTTPKWCTTASRMNW